MLLCFQIYYLLFNCLSISKVIPLGGKILAMDVSFHLLKNFIYSKISITEQSSKLTLADILLVTVALNAFLPLKVILTTA